MITWSTSRGALATAGFVAALAVETLVPYGVLYMAVVQAESNGVGPFGPFVTPAGLITFGLVWLSVVVGGIVGGARRPGHSFFRGAFLASFVAAGCVVMVLVGVLVSKLMARLG